MDIYNFFVGKFALNQGFTLFFKQNSVYLLFNHQILHNIWHKITVAANNKANRCQNLIWFAFVVSCVRFLRQHGVSCFSNMIHFLLKVFLEQKLRNDGMNTNKYPINKSFSLLKFKETESSGKVNVDQFRNQDFSSPCHHRDIRTESKILWMNISFTLIFICFILGLAVITCSVFRVHLCPT